MRHRLKVLFGKEVRQITRSKRTIAAAAAVPALMLIFVTFGDILTLKLGFGSRPIYLLSSSHALSGTNLLRHYTLPVLVTISALVTPSIMMGDMLWGERERGTLELLVPLPLTVRDMVMAKLASVLAFALGVTIPLFAVNILIVGLCGYGSPAQAIALFELLVAALTYSSTSALLVTLLAGEARAANIVSGLVLGPIVPLEGVILAAMGGESAISLSAATLLILACCCLLWSSRLLSWERLFAA